VINCESVLAILVSSDLKVAAAVNGIVTGALGGMLFNSSCVLIL